MKEKSIKWKILFENNSFFLDIKGQLFPLDSYDKSLFTRFKGDFVEIIFEKQEKWKTFIIKSIKSWISIEKKGILRQEGWDNWILSIEFESGESELLSSYSFSNKEISLSINKIVKLYYDKDSDSYKNLSIIKKYPFNEKYEWIFKIEWNKYLFVINWHKKTWKVQYLNISDEKDILTPYLNKNNEVATLNYLLYDENWTWKIKSIHFKSNYFSSIFSNFQIKWLPLYRYLFASLFFSGAIYFLFIDSFHWILTNLSVKEQSLSQSSINVTSSLSTPVTSVIRNFKTNIVKPKERICVLTDETALDPKIGVEITFDDLMTKTNDLICYQYDYWIKNIRIKIINENIKDISTITQIKNKVDLIKSKTTNISIDLVCKKSEQGNCSKTIKNIVDQLGKENISQISLSFSDFDPFYDSVVKGWRQTDAPILFVKNDLSTETVKKLSQDKYEKRIYYSFFWYINENNILNNLKFSSLDISKSFWIYPWSSDNQNFLFPDIKTLDSDSKIFNYFDIYLSSSDLKQNLQSYLTDIKTNLFYNIILDKNITESKEDLLFFSSFNSPNIEHIFVKF